MNPGSDAQKKASGFITLALLYEIRFVRFVLFDFFIVAVALTHNQLVFYKILSILLSSLILNT